MKRCPECRRDYHDDTLLYCLEDGAALVQGSVASYDEPQTAILPVPPAGAGGLTSRTDQAEQKTAIFQPVATERGTDSPARGIDKRLLLAPLLVGFIALAAFFGYKYYSPTKQIESIAVMPFVNQSGNAEIEYLSDGIAESLINNLSQLEQLSVKARSSVFRYKGKEVEPQQIAADLKVQAVLNGRVNQHGDNLTISLDLVDGSGNQVWGEQYTRRTGDLAALQSEIARDVSQKLRIRLTGAEENRVVKNQTQNSEAYQLYLLGRYNWNKRTAPAKMKAIEFFQEAIEKDPNYAMAYVGLAESYVISDTAENYTKIRAAALKALEIDPTLGEPHAALGASLSLGELDYAGAEKEYKRAIELSPNYATSYHWLAEDLAWLGRFDESLSFYKKAIELEPFSLAIGSDYGMALFFARRYDQSIEHLKKLIEMDPNYIRTHYYLARVYKATGRYEDALKEMETALMLEGKDPQKVKYAVQAILTALRSSGLKGHWSKTLEFMEKDEETPPIEIANVYAQLGDRDKAFKWLEQAIQDRNYGAYTLKVSGEWDNIRDDPRFSDALKRMKLPE
jgi:TolB-like protein/Tfp pilus assembly protein PilF